MVAVSGAQLAVRRFSSEQVPQLVLAKETKHANLADVLSVVVDTITVDKNLAVLLLKAVSASTPLATTPLDTEWVIHVLTAFVDSRRSEENENLAAGVAVIKEHADRIAQRCDVSRPRHQNEVILQDWISEPSDTESISVIDESSPKVLSRRQVQKSRSFTPEPEKTCPSSFCNSEWPWLPDAKGGGFARVCFTLFDDGSSSKLGKVLFTVLLSAIMFSTISFLLETLPEFNHRSPECNARHAAGLPLEASICEPRPDAIFGLLETVCIAVFTVDYVIRVCTVFSTMPAQGPADTEEVSAPSTWMSACQPLQFTFKYAMQPMNVVDLLAIMPFYVELALQGDRSSFLRTLRLARILRLFKLAKHHQGSRLFAEVMVVSGQPLMILLFFNLIMCLLFATAIFFAEGQEFSVADEYTWSSRTAAGAGLASNAPYPTGVYVRKVLDTVQVTPFRSIPVALWWVCVTTTTVGYGDIAPVTALGKTIGIFCFYAGIVFMALPIGVLCTNFETVYKRELDKAVAPPSDKMQAEESDCTGTTPREPESTPWAVGLRVRRAVFLTLEDPMSNRYAAFWSLIMFLTILVSVAAFICESMETFRYTPEACTAVKMTVGNCTPMRFAYFRTVEVVCIILFTVDYGTRMLLVHSVERSECGLKPRPRGVLPKGPVLEGLLITKCYFMQNLNLLDLSAIAPFYCELAFHFGGQGVEVLRVVRLVRIFRVLRMPRMRACVDMLSDIIVEVLPALVILLSVTMLMCVLFASLLYCAETGEYSVDHFKDTYPLGTYVRPSVDGHSTEVSPWRSIPFTFWWFFTTATTVGFGDTVPTTTWGRIIGLFTFYAGIILFALPMTIIGGAFNKFYPTFLAKVEAQAEASRSKQNSEAPCTERIGMCEKDETMVQFNAVELPGCCNSVTDVCSASCSSEFDTSQGKVSTQVSQGEIGTPWATRQVWT